MQTRKGRGGHLIGHLHARGGWDHHQDNYVNAKINMVYNYIAIKGTAVISKCYTTGNKWKGSEYKKPDL